jgi:hypothetical protein
MTVVAHFASVLSEASAVAVFPDMAVAAHSALVLSGAFAVAACPGMTWS